NHRLARPVPAAPPAQPPWPVGSRDRPIRESRCGSKARALDRLARCVSGGEALLKGGVYMARLDPGPQAARRWSTRAWLWLLRRTFGRELRPYPVLAHAPKVVGNLLLMNALFERGDWTLPVELRKLVHLRVATIVGCEFCKDILSAAGRKHGAGGKVD